MRICGVVHFARHAHPASQKANRFSLTTHLHPRALRQTGEEAIADIGFAGKTVANGAAGLIALIFVLNAIAYTTMRYNKPRYQLLVPPVVPTSS